MRLEALEMDGQLSGRRSGEEREAATPAIRKRERDLDADLDRLPRHLAFEAPERPKEDVSLAEPSADGVGRVKRQRLRLAERKKTETMIQIAARHHDAGDRRMPGCPWADRREAFDLRANLGR